MTLHLTPEMLESAYEMLRTTPPFKGWKLPDPDEIEFRVYVARDRHAGFRGAMEPGGNHEIQVSLRTVATLPTLLMCMAHEMIHLRRHLQGERYNCPLRHHGVEFQRLAKAVCRHHGFDEKLF